MNEHGDVTRSLSPVWTRLKWPGSVEIIQSSSGTCLEENWERTTNVCEGWYHRFNRRVGTVHPNVWRFIAKLKKEEMRARRAIRRAEAGARVSKRRRKYNDLNDWINNERRMFLARQLPLNLYWRQMRYVAKVSHASVQFAHFIKFISYCPYLS